MRRLRAIGMILLVLLMSGCAATRLKFAPFTIKAGKEQTTSYNEDREPSDRHYVHKTPVVATFDSAAIHITEVSDLTGKASERVFQVISGDSDGKGMFVFRCTENGEERRITAMLKESGDSFVIEEPVEYAHSRTLRVADVYFE